MSKTYSKIKHKGIRFGSFLSVAAAAMVGFAFTDKSEVTTNIKQEDPAPVLRKLSALSVGRSNEGFYESDFINPYVHKPKEINNEFVLRDPYHRVSESFQIPESLKPRVSFWLDVYTKYTSQDELIHHSTYPWIIFKVVDTRSIFDDPNVNKFTKAHRAEVLIKKERAHVLDVLLRLSRKKNIDKNLDKLTEEEARIVTMLKDIPGKTRKKVFLDAARGLRSQKGQKDFFQQGLISSAEYLPKMEEIFAQFDLPVEITRLPLVESSFNTKAVSKVGASGIWQFMPNIGATYMHMDENIDERNSPLKATRAAARMMLTNYKILKSWPLVMTAYNHGVGGVRKAMQSTKSDDLSTIINKYNNRAFGFASANFYTSFLAAVHAERYQEELFGNLPKSLPLKHEDYKIRKPIQIHKLAQFSGITLEEVRLYNPDLRQSAIRKNFTVPRGYTIHLPEGHVARLELSLIEARGNKSVAKESKKKSKRI